MLSTNFLRGYNGAISSRTKQKRPPFPPYTHTRNALTKVLGCCKEGKKKHNELTSTVQRKTFVSHLYILILCIV